MTRSLRFKLIALTLALLLTLAAGLPLHTTQAQGDPIPLRVEEAITGTLTAANPIVAYSVFAAESLRMAVLFDVTAGDMEPTLVVLDQDKATLLASAVGPNINGLIVKFPAQGEYYVGISVADSPGTSINYRLMINTDPPLPINPFVAQTFMVAGASADCLDNTPVAGFTPDQDLNVCFSLSLIDPAAPVEFQAQWWTPSGEMANEEGGTLDNTFNSQLLLTGLVFSGTPWEEGWWQVHFLINGELATIQWVPVRAIPAQ